LFILPFTIYPSASMNVERCSSIWMRVSATNSDYAKIKWVGRMQRVCSSWNQFIEGSNENSRSTRGQDLFDQRQPVALTADSDAERFLRARTNMFRRHVTLRMRTCNALRNTYASDNRRERMKLSDYIVSVRSKLGTLHYSVYFII